jgi:hypothetical protein
MATALELAHPIEPKDSSTLTARPRGDYARQSGRVADGSGGTHEQIQRTDDVHAVLPSKWTLAVLPNKWTLMVQVEANPLNRAGWIHTLGAEVALVCCARITKSARNPPANDLACIPQFSARLSQFFRRASKFRTQQLCTIGEAALNQRHSSAIAGPIEQNRRICAMNLLHKYGGSRPSWRRFSVP